MRIVAVFLTLIFGCAPAMAQDTAEARLREMLRRTTTDLRAAQDGQVTLQATLDQEKQKSGALQKQVDDLTAALAAPAKPSLSDEEIKRMRADLQDARTQVTTLQASLTQWRAAYQKAADIARAKDAESTAMAARAGASERRASVCTEANAKLESVANDILHLYQSQDFRSLLISSYEPILGLKKVQLENTIQDYEDKLLDQKYRPGGETAKTGASK